MKKALIVLLILAVAGGMFAQDISFSGHVGTGMFIDILEADDDVHVRADDDDAGVPVRGQFNVAVDDGDWGVNLGFRTDIGTIDGNYMYMNNAYGWLKFIDIIQVSAGLIDDGVWGTDGEIDDGFATGGGVRVEVMPFDGLNVGAFFSYPNGYASAVKVGNFLQESVFGFSYEADIFHIAAALKLFSKESDFDYADKRTAFDETDMKAIFAFGLDIIPGLSLLFDARLLGLGDYSNAGSMEIWEEADFAVSDVLSVYLHVGEGLTGPDGFVALETKAGVEFGVNDELSIGADADLFFDMSDGFDFATFGLGVWATYTIGGGWVTAGYGFEKAMKDYGDYLDHYIKLIFGWDF